MIRGRRFSPSLRALALVTAAVALFVSLGTWQLDRAAFKQSVKDTYERRLALDYRPFDPDEARDQLEYSRLLLRGRYDNAQNLLLDNQIHLGQAGYHVLTPFYLLDSDQVVLVNRGWIGWGARRELPASLPEPAEIGEAAGIVFYPGEAALKLGRVEMTGQWPQLVTHLDMAALAALYPGELLPFVIWLAPDRPGHFVRAWDPIWLPPEKSRAYALQWFSFAVVAIVVFFVLNLRKVE